MPMSKEEAAIAADKLLVQLIQHQPNMFAPKSLYSGIGKEVGEVIADLRAALIEMYEKQP